MSDQGLHCLLTGNAPDTPKIRNRLNQLIRMDKSIRQIWVNVLLPVVYRQHQQLAQCFSYSPGKHRATGSIFSRLVKRFSDVTLDRGLALRIYM